MPALPPDPPSDPESAPPPGGPREGAEPGALLAQVAEIDAWLAATAGGRR